MRVDPISTTISVIALAVSGYVALRDRARLRAKSTFQKFVNFPVASIKVEAVNVGRRPVILTRMVWHYGDASSTATPLGEDRTGIRLQEHEKFSENITDSTMLMEPNSGASLTDLRFEDTLGRQYRVKHLKKHLKRLFKDWNERNP